MNILDQFKKHITDKNAAEQRDKKTFWATDADKDKFEIYHSFKGTPHSNPFEAETLIMFDVGKNIEKSVVKTLTEMGLSVVPPEDEAQHHMEMEREGVKISGYLDSIVKEDSEKIPFECKSWYGDFQERELASGQPKVSYLKQIAMYMDFEQARKGYLFYAGRAKGLCFLFELHRNGTVFKCNNIQFDITDEYKRFASIWKDYIEPGIEPDSDYVYKIPIEEVDWANLSASKISDARTGKAVIGDWQPKYSVYKDMIVAKEAMKYGKKFEDYIGYSDAELARICELTKGYSSKARKK